MKVKLYRQVERLGQIKKLLRVLSFQSSEVPKACEVMNELGFENAYNLLGGFLEWDGEVV